MASATSIPWWDVEGVGGYETTNGSTLPSNPWDRVVIDYNDYFPGICEVSTKRQRKHHKKSSPAKDGGHTTILGYDLADVKITCTIWTPEQLEELVALVDRLFPHENRAESSSVVSAETRAALALAGIPEAKKSEKKPEPQPHSITHPALQMIGVDAIQFIDAEAAKPGPVAGSKSMVFSAIEYRPPKKNKAAKVTNKGAPATSSPAVANMVPYYLANPNQDGNEANAEHKLPSADIDTEF